jgi:hypothetical protein
MALSGTPRERLYRLIDPNKPVVTQEVHVATKAVHRRDPRRLQEHISRFIKDQGPYGTQDPSATS